jgi:hypothetical protein
VTTALFDDYVTTDSRLDAMVLSVIFLAYHYKAGL